MRRGRIVPLWQQRLLRLCLLAVVGAVFLALVLAPFVLPRRMETADTTAMRNELFELHLGLDAMRGALADWQAARRSGQALGPEPGLRFDERAQLVAHRLGVVLAYPGALSVLPESGETLRRSRDRLAAFTAGLAGDANEAPALRDRMAAQLGPDLVTVDRYVATAFRRLGQLTANDRTQMSQVIVFAQRLATFLLVVGVLTLIVLWMQHRVLRRAESSLNSVMGDLAEAQRIAHVGNVRRDFDSDTVTWSPEFARIYGLEPEGQMTGAQFEALLLPADVEAVLESEREAFARSAETRAPVRRDLTFRAQRRDGTVIELEVRSELTAHPDGTPQSMMSTVRDITVEGQARRALRESERSLAAAQRIAHLGSFRHAYATGRTTWSSELYTVLGRDPAQGPIALRHIVHAQDFEGVQAIFSDLLRGGPPGGERQASFDCRVLHQDGAERFIRGTAEMVYDEAGAPEMLTGSLQDVTSDIEQERVLREALSEAERANTAKSEFLAVMSHELRTPMNGVLGMLGAIEATPLDDHQRDRLRVARTSAEALLAILNDVLDMSKIEAGRMELEEQAFDLSGLVRGVADLYSEAARSKGVALAVRLAPDLPAWITADPLRLRQILANLVSNAVKFTHAGEVGLSVTWAPDEAHGAASGAAGVAGGGVSPRWLRFRVTDSGIGIPLDRHRQVFGRFNQLDASYTRRFGGSGLGLSISQSLAELMGARIDFASEPGLGSAFWLDIPARPAQPGPDPRAAGPEAALPRLSILVAEDNATNRLVARAMLDQLGQDAEFAEDGLAALAALERGGFDLVLMDVSMPRLDGIEATRRIRAGAAGARDIPVLALTAHAGETERRACLEAGCDEVLTKPLELPVLRRALARWHPRTHEVKGAPAPAPKAQHGPEAVSEGAKALPETPTAPEAQNAPEEARAALRAAPEVQAETLPVAAHGARHASEETRAARGAAPEVISPGEAEGMFKGSMAACKARPASGETRNALETAHEAVSPHEAGALPVTSPVAWRAPEAAQAAIGTVAGEAGRAPDEIGAAPGAGGAPEEAALHACLRDLASQIGPEAIPLLIAASLEDLARHRAVIEAALAGGMREGHADHPQPQPQDPQACAGPGVLRACHSVVGIAATLGQTATADLARRLEARLAGTAAPPPDAATTPPRDPAEALPRDAAKASPHDGAEDLPPATAEARGLAELARTVRALEAAVARAADLFPATPEPAPAAMEDQ